MRRSYTGPGYDAERRVVRDGRPGKRPSWRAGALAVTGSVSPAAGSLQGEGWLAATFGSAVIVSLAWGGGRLDDVAGQV